MTRMIDRDLSPEEIKEIQDILTTKLRRTGFRDPAVTMARYVNGGVNVTVLFTEGVSFENIQGLVRNLTPKGRGSTFIAAVGAGQLRLIVVGVSPAILRTMDDDAGDYR